MSVVGQTGSSGVVAPTSGGISSHDELQQTMDDFLLLLTTQMQNQDPLEPMDSEKFTEQLLNFSGIEQQINTNNKLDQLLNLTGYNQTMGMVDYIGTTVEYGSDMLNLSNGQASFNYALDTNAATTKITITDESGAVVRTLDGEVDAGSYSLTWDGKNDDGAQMPDGIYSVNITAADLAGETVEGSMTMIGRVTGVESQGGALQLMLGGLPISMDQVVGVHESSNSTPDPTDDDTTEQDPETQA
ncbi:flagellar hook assembly protein FlgD [Rhodovibrionaceae bacterium A322]